MRLTVEARAYGRRVASPGVRLRIFTEPQQGATYDQLLAVAQLAEELGFDAFFLDTKDVATWVGRLCTIVYFAFFFAMPWYTARDKCLPVPDRVTGGPV